MSTACRCAWSAHETPRDAASHADRFSPAQCLAAIDDIVGTTLNVDDILDTREHVAPLEPPPCPITIAWAGNDRLIAQPLCGDIARERLPQATFTTLPGVGHDPMIDDPALVARTILAVTQSAAG